MKILAIETATEACSAALLNGNEVLERYQLAPRGHGDLILHMATEVLAESGLSLGQLDAIAFGRGPGAFTGVRIACSVAQGIAFGADLPVIPVSTLATLAAGGQRVTGSQRIIAALDARMGEVYWGVFELAGGKLTSQAAEVVCAPGQVPRVAGGQWQGIGSGWLTYGEVLMAHYASQLSGVKADLLPQARDVAHLAIDIWEAGGAVAAEQALPVYLRDNVAVKSSSSS
ncbi:MAG: tRNA (adenosine(37)-N6)-threonylcarbamoyltransferase complex dimerization subunit type 1 TsaB [Gammaproteobacteria bacterium]|nr:tRNA (adenosine(37)-N6)-threonylcarbamoyltransferase complex dimerization subunit type 1 TsaB [Gammaproteobacteria bacterium]